MNDFSAVKDSRLPTTATATMPRELRAAQVLLLPGWL